MKLVIENGRVLRGDELVAEPLFVENGVIAAAAPSGADVLSVDAAGALVLPGIIDLHGDGFERQIMPRPKVMFPHDLALMETDRQMIANGITTAYHGVTVSWEPGLRSIESTRVFVESLRRIRSRLACDTRLHLRWETFALDALDEVLSWLPEEEAPIFAFNDHTTNTVQGKHLARKLPVMAARAGLEVEEYKALMERVWSRRDAVEDAICQAARQARDAGAILFAHDEGSPAEREKFRALGAVSSEFPMNPETAAAARSAGEHTILGAPNVVRGGSHNGMMDATTAIAGDLCTILASDYYYPSQLAAAFKLVAAGHATLGSAWALISKNPAASAGLHDRGELAPGKRADILLVDAEDGVMARVSRVFVAGRPVYGAG